MPETLANALVRSGQKLLRLGVAGFFVVGGATCKEITAPEGVNLVASIQGPPSVRVAEPGQYSVSVSGVATLGAAVVRWRTLDPTILVVDSVGLQVQVVGLRPGETTIEASIVSAEMRERLVQSLAIRVDPGPPAALRVRTAPSGTARVGQPIAAAPVVQVVDVSGFDVPAAGLAIGAETIESGASIQGAAATTDVDGRATFPDLALVGATGGYRLRFQSTTGLLSDTTGAVSLLPGPAVALAVAAELGAEARAGLELDVSPAVQLRDVAGNAAPDSGRAVRARVLQCPTCTTSGDSVQSDATGRASFPNLTIAGPVGTYRVEFFASDVGALAPDTTAPLALLAGSASALQLATAPAATVAAGAVLGPAQGPSVQLADAWGNAVSTSGVAVTAGLVSGAGLAGTLSTVTNSSGVAAFDNLRLNATVGAYQLRFRSTGLDSVTTSPVTVTAGAASALRFPDAAPDLVAGAPPASPLLVRIEDLAGNLVASSSATVSIALATAVGGATLGGVTEAQAVGGVAQFDSYVLTTGGSGYSLQATSGSLAAAGSTPFRVGGGTPAALTVLTQPSATAQSGVVLLTQPALALVDAYGNRSRQSGVVVTANVSGAQLLGTAAVTTDTAGVALFSGIAVQGTVGNYVLQFSAPGLQGTGADAVSVSAGLPARVAFRVPPGNVVAGESIAPAVEVELRDGAGNPVALSGREITVAVESAPEGVTAGPLATVPTVTGVASFPSLAFTDAGSYVLRASAEGVTSQVSPSFEVLSTLATQLALVTQPQASATSAAPLPVAPVVQLRDEFDNAVRTAGVPVSVAVQGGDAVLAGTQVVNTDTLGRAAFENLTLSGSPQVVTLRFSSAGLDGVTSNNISLVAGEPAHLEFVVQPAAMTAGTPVVPAIEVRITDASGTPLSTAGVSVTLSVADTVFGTLGGTVTRESVGGVATFADVTLERAGAGRVLEATATGLSFALSEPFTVGAAEADTLAAMSVASQAGVVGAAAGVLPQVRVVDRFGNPVQGLAVTFRSRSASGVIGDSIPLTDASGIAQLGSWTLDSVAGTHQVVALAAEALADDSLVFEVAAVPDVTDAARSTLALGEGATSTVAGGDSVPLVIVARDRFGNARATGGDAVAMSLGEGSSTGSFAAAVDSANGRYLVYFRGLLAGSEVEAEASLNGAALSLSPVALTVVPGAPREWAVLSGANQTAMIGARVGTEVSAELRDGGGNLLPNTFVVVENLSAGALLDSNVVYTDTLGVARVRNWRVSLAAGTNTVRLVAGDAAQEVQATARVPAFGTSATITPSSVLLDVRHASYDPSSHNLYLLKNDRQTVEVVNARTGEQMNTLALTAFSDHVATMPDEQRNALFVRRQTYSIEPLYALSTSTWQHMFTGGIDGISVSALDRSRGWHFTAGGSGTSGDIRAHDIILVDGLPAASNARSWMGAYPYSLVADTVTGNLLAMQNCTGGAFSGCALARIDGATLTLQQRVSFPEDALPLSPYAAAFDNVSGRYFMRATNGILVIDARNDAIVQSITNVAYPALGNLSALVVSESRRELIAHVGSAGTAFVFGIDDLAFRGVIAVPEVTSDLWVDEELGELVAFDAVSSAIVRASLETRTVVSVTSACCAPEVVAFDSEAQRVLIGGGREVGIFDASTLTQLGAIGLGITVKQLLVDPGMRRAFATDTTNQLAVINLDRNRVIQQVTLPCRATAMGLDEDVGRLWVQTSNECDGTTRVGYLLRSIGYSSFTPVISWVGESGGDIELDIARDYVQVHESCTLRRYDRVSASSLLSMSVAGICDGMAYDTESGITLMPSSFSQFALTSTAYILPRSPLDGPNPRASFTIPRVRAVESLQRARAFLAATSFGVSIISHDRDLVVRELLITGGSSAVAVDEAGRRAFVISGQQLITVTF